MKIEKINRYNIAVVNTPKLQKNKTVSYYDKSSVLTNSLYGLATLNKTSFTGYKIGMPSYELRLRTSDEHLAKVRLLKQDAPEFKNLATGDKIALKHLVLASEILNDIHLQLDDENNILFRRYLDREIKKGNNDAVMAKKLFDAQQGIFANDMRMNKLSLAKGLKESSSRGFYPRDLSTEEFHKILERMLKANKDDEVRQILSQRTVVVRDGKNLRAIDYVDKFKKEFGQIAAELEQAAKASTNKDFNEYLKLQAKAFRKADNNLDAEADIKWATLQDTPLEFTITRENYTDAMTFSIFENEKLLNLLKSHNITPHPKDSLGCRVGIVNKAGTEYLIRSKEYLPMLAKLMPFSDKYTQTITKDNKQTMVDVDIVAVTGDLGSYRGSITLAENLPNNDKLSLALGGGRRNVYHRQMRMGKKDVSPTESMLCEEQRAKVNPENYHYFTIGHENAHSLGPKKVNNLGKYRNIIEENKADMGSMAFLDTLTELGMYTPEERDSLLNSYVSYNFLPVKPLLTNAHRVRQVMQCKYFEDNGVFEIDKNGDLYVHTEKVIPTAKKMLAEIIQIQLADNYQEAENFVNKYFVWTDKMEYFSQILKKKSLYLNGKVESPLADYLKSVSDNDLLKS